MNRKVLFTAVLALVSTGVMAEGRPCDDLKSEIAAKLDAKGVVNYQLEIVANDAVGTQKVVGSCEAGTKKITYTRGASSASTQGEAKAAN